MREMAPSEVAHFKRRRWVVRNIVIAWLVLAVVAVAVFYYQWREGPDKLGMLLKAIPSGCMPAALVDGWEAHDPLVYAYTRRSPLPLKQIRDTLLDAHWLEGDGRKAIVNNSRLSYPGFFEPSGMMGAPFYMTSGQTEVELWAFDNGAIFVRKRIGKNIRYSTPSGPVIIEKLR